MLNVLISLYIAFCAFRRAFYAIVIFVQQLKERDSKLEEAGDLHRFLRSVDHFQAWLTKTQTDVASEGKTWLILSTGIVLDDKLLLSVKGR